ncbi:sigma-70 family RNA polymerase sigma factor [Candidatus Peregrinibacteria bacterium]|nr:sigma-70 family RNA polymerase sigma factor [Candidatus Peregrinibacteria bacterium]
MHAFIYIARSHIYTYNSPSYIMADKDLSPKVQQRILEEFKTNKEVFEELYTFYYERILKYLLKRTASAESAYDLTAETFIKAFESLHKFKWTGVSIKVWLYRIAINQLKNHRRKPKNIVLTEKMEGLEQMRTEAKEELEELDKTLFGDEDLTKLSDAIATLNPKYQHVVSLHYFEGMSHEEIATVIQRSKSAVKSMMHRALTNLRQLLAPNAL